MTTRRQMLMASTAAALTGGALAPGALAALGGRVQDDKLNKVFSQMYDGSQYTLPPLPYDYDALEPHIDQQTMQLHHGKHHQGYVNGLNKTVATLKELAGQQEIDDPRLYGLQRNLSFNYGGHVLHSVFWATLKPAGSGSNNPEGELAAALESSFGSFENFQRLFKSSALSVKGSGWGVVVYDPVSSKLAVKAMHDQDVNFPPGGMPILPLDVWEHAYYLKYQNNRAAYVDAWWNVVDWRAVDALFRLMQQTFNAM